MTKFYKKGDATKKEISIINDKDTFFQLSNGEMIKKDVFSKYFDEINDAPLTESINPSVRSNPFHSPDDGIGINANDFFNTSPIGIDAISKLKSMNTSQMNDIPQEAQIKSNNTNQTKQISVPNDPYLNEPIIRQDPNPKIPNNTNTDVSQYKVYDNDDDAYEDFVNKGNIPQTPQPQTPQPQAPIMTDEEVLFENEKMAYGEDEAVIRRNIRAKRNKVTPIVNDLTKPSDTLTQPQQPVFDPVVNMFKTIKRNHDVEINISFEDKIGNPDFVKMMLENMDGDIVGYYKKIIMDNFLNNMDVVGDEVEKQIKIAIYGEEEYKAKVKRKSRSKSNPKYAKLVKGKVTRTGGQTYKYVTAEGKIKDVLPNYAEKKGYKPFEPKKKK